MGQGKKVVILGILIVFVVIIIVLIPKGGTSSSPVETISSGSVAPANSELDGSGSQGSDPSMVDKVNREVNDIEYGATLDRANSE